MGFGASGVSSPENLSSLLEEFTAGMALSRSPYALGTGIWTFASVQMPAPVRKVSESYHRPPQLTAIQI
jgi:hypothetical protein